MMVFVMGIGALAMCIAYVHQDMIHEAELKASYEKGYKDGLYENVIKFSSREED